MEQEKKPRKKTTKVTNDKSTEKVSKTKKTPKSTVPVKTPTRAVRASKVPAKALEQLQKGEITPGKYFKAVKKSSQKETKEMLQSIIDTSEKMYEMFELTGQTKAASKMKAKIEVFQRQVQLVEAGFDTYIKKSDLTKFVADVKNDRVKFINLEDYERLIPEDVLIKLKEAKPLFDKLYIVYTDYSTQKEEEVKRERKEKDPILLGAICNPEDNPDHIISGHIYERMFVIADWVDEYCDLTLDKLITKYADMYKDHPSPAHRVNKPKVLSSAADLNAAIKAMEDDTDNTIITGDDV